MADFPECAVCKTPFKWKGPDPYLLPCLHAICENCLISTGTGSCRCSKCQRVHNFKQTTLQKDKVRQRLMLHLTAKHRPTELLCTHEDDGNQAVCWCQECEEFLCEHCQNLHEEFKATRRHEVLGIFDIKTSKDDEEVVCAIHSRYALELMDHDCGILICLKCKQEDHAGHHTEDINTVIRSSEEELQCHIKAIADVKKEIQDRLNKTGYFADELDKDAFSQRDKIKNTFDTLTGLLVQREKEIMLAFDTHLDKAKATTSNQRLSLDLHQSICSDILEYTQTALDHAGKSDLPIILCSIRNPLEECLQSDLLKKDVDLEQPTVTFQDDDLLETKRAISTFSEICHNGKTVAPSTGDKHRLSYVELEKRCESLAAEAGTKQGRILSLQQDLHMEQQMRKIELQFELQIEREKQKQTLAAAGVVGNIGTKSVPTYSFRKEREYQVDCGPFEFCAEKLNTDSVHLNKEGALCNGQNAERFKEYRGTSSTEPLLQSGHVQYWETLANIGLNQMISFDDLLLEIGICWEEERDKSYCMQAEPHSYGMYVSRCRQHKGICMSSFKEGKTVMCWTGTLLNKKGSSTTLHWGLVYDPSKKKITFLDVKTYTVLAVLDNLDMSQPLWPMYGVYNSKRGSVSVKLIVGKDIDMSAHKRSLILGVL